jgi:ADP-ribose pyrophosphatase YjhB (NUDIX family)
MLYKFGLFFAFVFFNLINMLTLGHLSPLITVSLVVIHDGQVLAIDHHDSRGFTLPGGLVKWGETIQEAAIRELKEETGYIVKTKRLIGIYQFPHERFYDLSMINFAYEGKIVSGQLRSSLEGKTSWVDPSQIKEEKGIITDYLQQKEKE